MLDPCQCPLNMGLYNDTCHDTTEHVQQRWHNGCALPCAVAYAPHNLRGSTNLHWDYDWGHTSRGCRAFTVGQRGSTALAFDGVDTVPCKLQTQSLNSCPARGDAGSGSSMAPRIVAVLRSSFSPDGQAASRLRLFQALSVPPLPRPYPSLGGPLVALSSVRLMSSFQRRSASRHARAFRPHFCLSELRRPSPRPGCCGWFQLALECGWTLVLQFRPTIRRYLFAPTIFHSTNLNKL